MNDLLAIEELSTNAWPALKTHLYDGWVLRFANGYTKRANSVHPLYSSTLPPAEKIACCEALYREEGLPSIFKLTRASLPSSLDRELEIRQYERWDETSVQVLRLGGVQPFPKAGVEFSSVDSNRWIPVFSSFNPLTAEKRQTLERMLANITGETSFGLLMEEGQAVACGLGVLVRGGLGLFDLVVSGEHRGKGLGECLVQNMLCWGQGRGAHTAYLQVMMDNERARNLYGRLGFGEIYRYWYRVKG